MDSYGDLVPYADPNWYQSYHTPYFNQSHADLRAEVRHWMEEDIMPYVTEWDEAKKVPDSVYKAMGEKGACVAISTATRLCLWYRKSLFEGH